jgi:hypothetical protein
MTKIAYPTEIDIDGPWLIEGGRLQELDSVLDKCFEKMRVENTRMVNERIEAKILERMQERHLTEVDVAKLRADYEKSPPWYGFDGDKRSVTIYLSGGRTIEGARFSDFLATATLQNEIARGFVATAKVGQTEATVRLASGYFQNHLSIKTSPRNNDVALETFGLLQNWQVDVSPKRWQQLWLKVSWLLPMFAVIWLVIGMSVMAGLADAAPQRQLKEEARQLIRQGINPSNQLRAEQLLLEIESDYVPDQKTPDQISPRMWTYFVVGLACLIALSFCPKLCIGIWADRAKLQHYRWWFRVISVTIPGLLITRVAFPWLPHLLGWNPR